MMTVLNIFVEHAIEEAELVESVDPPSHQIGGGRK